MKLEVRKDGSYVIPKLLASRYELTGLVYHSMGDIADAIGRSCREVVSAHVNDCVEALGDARKKMPYMKCFEDDGTFVFDDRYTPVDKGELSAVVDGVHQDNGLKHIPMGKKTMWASESPKVGACAYMLMFNNSLERYRKQNKECDIEPIVIGDSRWQMVHDAIKNEYVCKQKTVAIRIICYGSSVVDAVFVDVSCRGSLDWFYSYKNASFASRYALFRYLEENTDFPVPPNWRNDYAWEKDRVSASGYIVRNEGEEPSSVFFSIERDEESAIQASECITEVEACTASEDKVEATSVEEEKIEPDIPEQSEVVEPVMVDRFFLSPDGVKYTDIESFEKDFSCSRTEVLSWLDAGFTLREAIKGGYMAGEADDGRFDFDGKVSYKGLECDSLTELCYLLRLPRRVILTRRRRSMSLESAIEMPTADRDLFSMLFVEYCK